MLGFRGIAAAQDSLTENGAWAIDCDMNVAAQHPTQPLDRALASLNAALATLPMTDVVRDGALHRFEFTFELSWKTIRIALTSLGRDVQSSSPKPLFRDALREGLIGEIEPWFSFLQARNVLSHTYDEKQSQNIFRQVCEFPPHCAELIENLKKIDYG